VYKRQGERISDARACANLVKTVLTNYHLPYITITPTFSICPKHGYLAGEHDYCPKCDEEIGYEGSSIDEEVRKQFSSIQNERILS
jgi:ribonucleoside-triphosphate reductase